MPVYFARENAPQGAVIIGYTAGRPETRLSTIQIASSRRLIMLAIIDGGLDLADRVRARFYPHRIRGQWFRPADALLEYVASLPAYVAPYPRRRASAVAGMTVEQVEGMAGAREAGDAVRRALHAVASHKVADVYAASDALAEVLAHAETSPAYAAGARSALSMVPLEDVRMVLYGVEIADEGQGGSQ